jgi:tetratricopeptide (TPR) repeat protein
MIAPLALMFVLRAALAADPEVVQRHWHLARAYMEKGMPSHAEEEARVVLRLEPGHPGATALLATHRLEPEGTVHPNGGIVQGGPVSSTVPAAAPGPDPDGVSLAAEAIRAYRESRVDDAHRLASQVVLADPANIPANGILRHLTEEAYQPTPLGVNDVLKELFAQGMALYRREEWAGAAAIFQKALAVSPTHDQTRMFFGRARTHAEESRTTGALAQAREAIAAGRPVEARAALKSVMEINPNNAEATALLASLGDDARAADRRAQAKAHFNTGVEAYEQGRWADAIREWDLVTTLDPADQEAAKLLRKARSRQTAARKDAKVRIPGMHEDAMKLYQQGKLAEARAVYKDILELDPQDEKAQRSLEVIDEAAPK